LIVSGGRLGKSEIEGIGELLQILESPEQNILTIWKFKKGKHLHQFLIGFGQSPAPH